MASFLLWFSAGFVAWLVYSSFFEWTMHRYVMHRPFLKWTYPFRAHAIIHHQTFKADHTYHLIDESDKHTIPMAWWNGPVIIFLVSLPALPISRLLGQLAFGWGAVAGITTYYCVYEYIHWCMHLPKARKVEKSGLFYRLNGHHLLHHRYMHKNFNVVIPIADLCLGTLLLRSKVKFAQASGPSVPNVQPHEDEPPLKKAA